MRRIREGIYEKIDKSILEYQSSWKTEMGFRDRRFALNGKAHSLSGMNTEELDEYSL
jgi:hypothetical protein